jgi:ATP-binding cassette subfamily B (MDR/TAP) protein 1
MSDVLRPIILWFCYLGLAATVAGYLEIVCFEVAGMRQANRIRRQYLTALLRQEMGFFDLQDSGALLARVVADTNAIQEAISSKLPNLIQHGSSGCLGVLIGLIRGWQMALVVCSTLPLLGAAGGMMASAVSHFQKLTAESYADASALTKETMSQMRVVAAYGGEKRAIARYVAALKVPYQAAVLQAKYGGFSMGTVFLVMFLTYALALWYGSTLILSGKYTGGQVMNVLFAVIIGGFEGGQATPNLSAITAARVAATSAFKAIDRQSKIPLEVPGAEEPKTPLHGAVELRDVVFSYPSRPGVTVMQGTSLDIPAGRSMALVGASGSGKSTIVQLIQRFYDPGSGAVLLDGVDLRSLSLAWVRRHMGMVSQEPALFSGTIRANIMYGKQGASQEELEAAAAAANASGFISKLPQGFETLTGERGVQLSGGQKQRVAIARAVLRNPRILLLDEATSALDSESERVVQEALDKLIAAGGRTSIIIAHRLSTIRDCDCITVMAKGAVVQRGSHAELVVDSGGAYAALLRAQHGQVDEMEAAQMKDAPLADEAHAVAEAENGGVNPHTDCGGGGNDGAQPMPGAESDKSAPAVPTSRIWALGKSKSALLPLGIMGSMVNGAIMPSFSLALSSVIGAFIGSPSQIRAEVDKWCLIFVGIAFASFIALVVQTYALGIIGAELANNARAECFASIVRMEASWFDKEENSSGRLATRLEEDTANIRGAVTDNISVAAQNLTVMAGGLAIAFAYSPYLTLVILGTLPLLMFGAIMQMRILSGVAVGDSTGLYAAANQLLADALVNVRTVAAYGLAGDMVELYAGAQEGPAEQLRYRANVNGFAVGFGQGMFVFLYALSFWFGGWLVDHPEVKYHECNVYGHCTDRSTQPADIFKCFFAVVFLGMGGAQASIAFPALAKGGAAVKSVFSILDRPSVIDPFSTDGTVLPDGELKGAIEMRDVVFCYPSRPTTAVLSSMRLAVPAATSMALVGASGSGKSTIVQLLLRFYDPASGVVMLDGLDLRKLNLSFLRSQIGLVSQEPALFSASIAENIGYGREGASQADIEAAAAAANAAEFIDRLPLRYDTACGERGVQLSGGQKQRVAIARAVLRNPRILLLDEATSALDSESERVVQEALDKLIAAGGRTSIIIAHRLSTIRDCDCITVMAKGAVIESGSHETLLRDSAGSYTRMHQLQSGRRTSLVPSASSSSLNRYT